jgi:hypothetical protein
MRMSTLIPTGLAVSALLVLGYIVGTELCLPSARHALHTGDMALWRLACRLVTAGEWAIITVCASFLLLAEHEWQLLTATPASEALGLSATVLLTALVLWEITGRTRKRTNTIMRISLGLVLPARGKQRELYEQLQSRFESGSATERQQVLQSLQSLHYPVAVH